MKPDDMHGEERPTHPRTQRERDSGQKNQVPDVHRIAHVAVRTLGHEPLRRDRQSRPAAAFAQSIAADEPVLQVAPDEQRRCPQIDRKPAAMQRYLDCGNGERPDDERPVRRAGEPAPDPLRRVAYRLSRGVAGIQRMNRLATMIVAARNQKVAIKP